MTRRLERSEKALRVREVRCTYQTLPNPGRVIASPDVAASVLSTHFQTINEPVEMLVGLYLDAKNQLIAIEHLYRGTINATTVSTRDVIRTALMVNAPTIIVAHNHPSGSPEPSADDLLFTRRLVEAARFFSIEVADHLILGFTGEGALRFISLKQRGAM
jgi:DNA repair protein RadC